MNLGYACINTILGTRGILTGRAMRASTLQEKGLAYASKLALQNAVDLEYILRWNVANDIFLFRVGSDVFPWGNKINVFDYPDIEEIKAQLKRCGDFAKSHNMRITAHPGPFNLLASGKETVVENTIRDLEMHALMFDFMGLERSHYNKINIHVGATYGNKDLAAATWCENFLRLSEGVQSRLTVENDDKASMFSVQDLYNHIHLKTNVPIVFDYHHHTFNTGDLSEEQALKLAVSTWKTAKPVVHYSESRALHENDTKINPRAHSDFIDGPIDLHGIDVDVMIEAKAKERALLKFRKILL